MMLIKAILVIAGITLASGKTVDRCSQDYPFAYLSGEFCCKTNQELKGGDSRTPKEISSGTCDGIGFSMESTCCKDHDYQKCPYPGGCSDHKDRCSQDYPFAYLSGEFCCKTNQELQRGSHRTASEINSGKCDGSGFSRESTCCKDHDFQECPYQDGCYNYWFKIDPLALGTNAFTTNNTT